MDLPTYTNIWRIEKRLYKLYDLRLPMPLPLVQIGVFLGVFVPWILLLRIVGVPFESPWHVLYIVPPGVLTWLATRPVIEGKRLTELLLSQARYLSEPRTWCRLTPIREPREVVIVARVWRRADAPAPIAAAERAAIKAVRKQQAVPVPTLLASPSSSPASPPLAEHAPAAQAPPAPAKPWRRTTRDISHEDDVQPVNADLEHPPATPRLETPPAAPGSGKRALASGIRRPGAPAEFWQATPHPTPQEPQDVPAPGHAPAEHSASGSAQPPPRRAQDPASGAPASEPAPAAASTHKDEAARGERVRAQDVPVAGRASGEHPASGAAQPPTPGAGPRVQGPASGVPVSGPAPAAAGAREGEAARGERVQGRDVPVAGHGKVPASGTGQPGSTARPPGGRDVPVAGRASGERPAVHGHGVPAWSEGPGVPAPGQGEPGGPAAQRRREDVPAPRASGGEAGDKKVAGSKKSAAEHVPAEDPGVRETRRDVPQPWAPPQREAPRPPAPRPGAPRPTRPDIPMVPGAFGTRPPEPPRMEAPRPWSEGLSKPRPTPADGPARPAAGEAAPRPPVEPPPVSPPPPAEPPREQAPPREVRSQPASPVRPRPLPPPPAPPQSGPAITPPDPEHEVSGGGLRRLFHAVGGGHGDVDAEYQQRLQQPFHGTRHVVVLGCTGGAGQTVTALMLGHTFAQHNGEPVVAIDVNPGPGALARRTRSDTNETLTGLITRADQVNSLTAMRRYTSQAKSGLDVIAAGKNPLQALDDRDYALAIRTIDKFYSVTLLDAAAAVVARVLPYADQIVLVAPASADAPRAVAMTFEWLDGHGYEELRSRAVTVINGVSRRSMDDVEQAEAVARGRCRALVRIPWDDHLSMDRAPRNELKSLRSPTRRAYLALAGVVAGGFTVMPERYQEPQQEQEATR